jgi:hypothetical protein
MAKEAIFVTGLDMVLDKLRVAGADFSTVSAISGQQTRVSLFRFKQKDAKQSKIKQKRCETKLEAG